MTDKRDWSNSDAIGAFARSLGGSAVFGKTAALLKPEPILIVGACVAGLVAGYFLDRIDPRPESRSILGNLAKRKRVRRENERPVQSHT